MMIDQPIFSSGESEGSSSQEAFAFIFGLSDLIPNFRCKEPLTLLTFRISEYIMRLKDFVSFVISYSLGIAQNLGVLSLWRK